MKITPADTWFSLCIRERADWTCESCGKRYTPEYSLITGLPKNQALHCSHYFGRGNWATRFEPNNAFAHCYGCHAKFEGSPHAFREWVQEKLGTKFYDDLVAISCNVLQGRAARKEKKAIASFYEREYQKMVNQRNNGRLGRLHFAAYFD